MFVPADVISTNVRTTETVYAHQHLQLHGIKSARNHQQICTTSKSVKLASGFHKVSAKVSKLAVYALLSLNY